MKNITKTSNNICLILPYYGKFPNYFHLWVKSASINGFVDFYIITDSEFPFQTFSNIHVVHKSLSDIRKKLDEITGISVKLEKPYKLCDYKPTYGLVFDDIIKSYDYWGWCDPDIIWGDLNKLLTDEILQEYDVIGGGGAFTILKNKASLKNYFFTQDKNIKSFSFLEACSTNHNLIFDEWGAVQLRKKQQFKETSQYDWLYKNVLDIIPPPQKICQDRTL